VLSITIVSDDATIWSITYDRHYDDRNSFIIQATDFSPETRFSDNSVKWEHQGPYSQNLNFFVT
jgi:hypothetical protein